MSEKPKGDQNDQAEEKINLKQAVALADDLRARRNSGHRFANDLCAVLAVVRQTLESAGYEGIEISIKVSSDKVRTHAVISLSVLSN